MFAVIQYNIVRVRYKGIKYDQKFKFIHLKK